MAKTLPKFDANRRRLEPVRAIESVNISLTSVTVVDSLTPATGDRFCLASQSDPTENGIYVFDGADLVRPSDFPPGMLASGCDFYVMDGTFDGTIWAISGVSAVVDTDSIVVVIVSYLGADGDDGNLIFTYAGNPNSFISANAAGDICLDTTTGDIYQASGSGTAAWGSPVDNITGPAGDDGADGAGVPSGGTTGQILAKVDGTDYNTQWASGIPINALQNATGTGSVDLAAYSQTWNWSTLSDGIGLLLQISNVSVFNVWNNLGSATVTINPTVLDLQGSNVYVAASGGTLAFFGGTPASKQSISYIGSLTFSDPPTQAECEALRDACVALQNALVTYGLIETY